MILCKHQVIENILDSRLWCCKIERKNNQRSFEWKKHCCHLNWSLINCNCNSQAQATNGISSSPPLSPSLIFPSFPFFLHIKYQISLITDSKHNKKLSSTEKMPFFYNAVVTLIAHLLLNLSDERTKKATLQKTKKCGFSWMLKHWWLPNRNFAYSNVNYCASRYALGKAMCAHHPSAFGRIPLAPHIPSQSHRQPLRFNKMQKIPKMHFQFNASGFYAIKLFLNDVISCKIIKKKFVFGKWQ